MVDALLTALQRSRVRGVGSCLVQGFATATIVCAVAGASPVSGLAQERAVGVDADAALPDSSEVGLLFDEDFSQYRSIAEFFRATPDGFYRSRGRNSSRMSLDTTTHLPELQHSLLFTYPDRSESRNRCSNYSIGREIWFPKPEDEIWIEVWVQFSDEFTTRAPRRWRCVNNPDLKLLLGLVSQGSGRFQIKVGKFGKYWATGYPGRQDQTLRLASTPYFDGRWHQLRARWRAADGLATSILWVDGRRVFAATNEVTTGSQIAGLRMGATLNQGPGHTMRLWWGSVRVWREPPDWYDHGRSSIDAR